MARENWKDICGDVKDVMIKLSKGGNLTDEEKNQVVQFYLEVVADAYDQGDTYL